jgi:c-di-GMP-binding flagellar brake protein YcgR
MLQSVITERRAHARQPLRTSAALLLPLGRMVLARTLDIGAEGAAVVADLNPGEAAPLAIKLRLPARPQGSQLFEAPAHVVHAVLAGREAGFRLSLKFGQLDAEAKKALSGFLSREPVAGLSFVRW